MGKKWKDYSDDNKRGYKKAIKLQKALKHYSLVKSYNLTMLFKDLDKDHNSALEVREFQ
jgi:hypothetical protein